jgi:hypothetical protein
MAKKITILAVFSNYDHANQAVEELHAILDKDSISVLAQEQTIDTTDISPPLEIQEEELDSVKTGAAAGGIAGLLSGLSAIAIPGLGPIFAIGPIFSVIGSTAIGTGLGATVGAALGGLLGLPKSQVDQYVEALEKGNVLVAVDTPVHKRKEVEAILNKNHASQLTIK